MIKAPITKNDSVHEDFFESLNDILQSLPVDGKLTVQDDKWCFKNHKGYIETLDFSYFSSSVFKDLNQNQLSFQDTPIELKLKEYVKFLFLHLLDSSQDSSNYNYRLIVLKMLFLFLAQNTIIFLNKDSLEEFYATLLTFDINKNGFVKRFAPPSYKVRFIYFNEKKLLAIASRFKAVPIVKKKVIDVTSKLKNRVCEEFMDMTLKDYIDGGSYNFLGLSVGKHYVDHCYNIFQDHGIFATACRNVLDRIYQEEDGATKKLRIKIVGELLMGVSPKDIQKPLGISKENSDALIKSSIAIFVEVYNKSVISFKAGDIDFVNGLLGRLNLPLRYDNQEFIKSLMFSLLSNDPIKSISGHLEEYRSLLKEAGTCFEFSLFDVKAAISDALKGFEITKSELPNIFKDQLNELALLSPNTQTTGVTLLNSYLYLVESAGFTSFLALTGWRRSEYGFPLSSINVSLNIEPSDNAYTPYRFHVNWVVPKTSKDTKLDREITLGAYLIAKQLNKLNISEKDMPCLYHISSEENPWSSTDKAMHMVKKAWSKFPFQYVLFKGVDKEDNNILDHLSVSERKSLKAIKDELTEAIPLFDFMYERTLGEETTGKKIEKYRKGELDDFYTNLLDKFLSEETKERIKSAESITRQMTKAITKELVGDFPHPTPHAFRHIWAEAVLLRYRGDVGKFIRANFKHLDEGFFMSYIRGKETKLVMAIAKRKVINSIVAEQMMAAKSDDGAYAGGFDRFISKAAAITKILSNDEYIKKARDIAEHRIVDIKSNAWVTCMLRKGTFGSAKCSEDGIPKRFNAAPKLCLGCTNANVSEGNFNGIVVYTKADVEACREVHLPYFTKRDSVKTLRSALKRVSELYKKNNNTKYKNFINYLMESIGMAEDTKKLGEEE
jgi:hypothetical protein